MIESLSKAVYGRSAWRRALLSALAAASIGWPAVPAIAQPGDSAIVEARDALRRKDGIRLADARAKAVAAQHPLAMWADYWELQNRLPDARQEELSAFFGRWSGTYVEDRLRNDWLLELGKRRDWTNFAAEHPRFRMNDDREVACYALLVDQIGGKDVKEAALKAWFAQREADDGCTLLAATLFDAKAIGSAEVWRKVRFSADANRPRAARQAAALLSTALSAGVAEAMESPATWLARKADASPRSSAELATVALIRMAAGDPDSAASMMHGRWDKALPADLAAWAWASIGRQAAQALLPDAADHFRRASLRSKGAHEAEWPEDTRAWRVRAALRADNGRARWQDVVQTINAMGEDEQRDPAWVYWKARGLQALARDSQDAEGLRTLAQELLTGISGQMHFYGKLAAEALNQPVPLPPRPAPLTEAERAAAAAHPGLNRALMLIALGLRNEGVREWNWSLRGMGDRELLAAAQFACDREVWDRCINTSDRTRSEVDLDQRFPMPFRQEVQARAREIGLDPAYVYGLIRQESRFVMDARSSVGASGLMQLMPATARWTARRIGLDYSGERITDRDTNIRLGTSYLKFVLDDFGGSQAMAAAAYNAGPNRPRKWREGPWLDPAVWAENIPFAETRDYVKKVLSNATYYAALMGQPAPSLKARLGRLIGPREAAAPAPDTNLP